MRHIRHNLLGTVVIASVALAACSRTPTLSSNRLELPQSMRMQQSDLLTTFESRSGRIAVIGRDGNLRIMDQTGKGVVEITREAGARAARGRPTKVYQVPIWSPDGKRIAFVENTVERQSSTTVVEIKPEKLTIERGDESQRFELSPATQQRGPGLRQTTPEEKTTTEVAPDRVVIERGLSAGKLVNAAVYVGAADGKEPLTEVTLTSGDAIDFLDWSPRGDKLAFQTRSERGGAKLNMVEVDNGRPRELLSGDTRWNWSPDGKSIVARQDAGTRTGAASLQLIDTVSEKATTIAGRGNVPFRTPHYSPDNRAMLVTQESRSGSELWLADANGNPNKKLVSFNGRISFAWSPAGVKVAYVVRETGAQRGGALRIIDVNTGDDRVATPYPVSAFFWAPDGQRIMAFGQVRPQDVPQDYPGLPLISEQTTDIVELLMVDVVKQSTRRLYLFEPTQAFTQVLAEFERYSRAITLWSPDSRRIVFPLQFAGGNGTTEILVQSEATGSVFPRLLAYGSMAVWSPK